LREEISKLEKQLKADKDTGSVFTKLKEQVASFISCQSEPKQNQRQQR
jgi:hypothetical protein